MALTDSEKIRLETMETVINDLQVAISNLMAKQQMRQLLQIKQKEVDALTVRVASLESQVAVLQAKI